MALRLGVVAAVIGAITLIYLRLVPVNAATVGFTYLVLILVIATVWGLLESTAASVAAVLCLNYFFLPPVGTFTIADSPNWVALFAFLATAIIASQLSARAKQRAQEALDRQGELEKLYALSRAILLTDASQAAGKQIALQIAQIFEFAGVALYDHNTGEIHSAGPEGPVAIEDRLRQAALQGTLLHNGSSAVVAPVILGGQAIGSLAVYGRFLSDTALQSVANLVAIGLEKVRGQEAANRAEAARQSDELKSTLLDALAHEFKTPLTSIKAASTALLCNPAPKAEVQRELLTIVDEEADRLGRLVTEAIQMARIEAGKVYVNRKPHSVCDLISTVLREMKSALDGRTVDVRISPDLPPIAADLELMDLALRQLIDNGAKYSPGMSPLQITAEQAGDRMILSVADGGQGIPEREQGRIFEKFYRGPRSRQQVTGSGMGLAIARQIVEAHDGEIWVKSGPGQGSRFFISVPIGGEWRRQ